MSRMEKLKCQAEEWQSAKRVPVSSATPPFFQARKCKGGEVDLKREPFRFKGEIKDHMFQVRV